jgi:small ligand-binding sensory domain FIST
MKWASAISEQSDLDGALAECAESIRGQLGEAPHLVVAFVSPHYQPDYGRAGPMLSELLGAEHTFGCSGGGIIGAGLEVEQRPALSITAAALPGVNIEAFHLDGDKLPDLDAGPDKWRELVGVAEGQEPQFVLLADPFSFPVQNLIMGLDFAFPKAAKIGGLASGAQRAGDNALFLDGQVHGSGAIGLALHGNITVDTVVAQGCRPIGDAMRITSSNRNVLVELDGKTPMAVLQDLFRSLSERDRQLMGHSLFLGVVMDELVDNPVQGDFLIRNVVGMDQRTGSLAIGEMLKEGQLVQFHLRDAETSAQDLTFVLERYAAENRENEVPGALLFSCLGRGEYLYGRPNHDTDIFREKLGQVPLGGFFCNGEIGPVGGTTFLHGYTSSFGLFRSRE